MLPFCIKQSVSLLQHEQGGYALPSTCWQLNISQNLQGAAYVDGGKGRGESIMLAFDKLHLFVTGNTLLQVS